jgi:MFS transporter, FHS family, L-fucose permease
MIQKKNPFASLPVFLAFLCMGFGDVVGPLTGLIKQEFQLSNLLAQMIPFMGFLMFGLLSIPIGVAQDNFGKKSILMTGLCLALFGLMIPLIGRFSSYIALLAGILMLGAGATFLQVSGNPLMRDVSAQGKYSSNLSLAQFIKAIGSLSGALIPLAAANYWNTDWKILFPVYSVFVLLTIIWLWIIKIKDQNHEKVIKATFASSIALLRKRFIFLMVLGIFLYVGAEVSMSSGLPIYLHDSFNLDIAKLGLLGTLFFFIALMTGRFLGAIILNWLPAKTFLKISVLISILGILGLFAGVQIIAMISIFLIGLGFANIFPLIFSITVETMPARSNELSGLMVAAIVGGALIPPIMGLVADLTSTLIAFIVPLVCILFILSLSFIKHQESISN